MGGSRNSLMYEKDTPVICHSMNTFTTNKTFPFYFCPPSDQLAMTTKKQCYLELFTWIFMVRQVFPVGSFSHLIELSGGPRRCHCVHNRDDWCLLTVAPWLDAHQLQLTP